MHIPKGFANYLLVGSTLTKKLMRENLQSKKVMLCQKICFRESSRQSNHLTLILFIKLWRTRTIKLKTQHTTHNKLKLKYHPISCQHSIKIRPPPTFTESSFNLICLLELAPESSTQTTNIHRQRKLEKSSEKRSRIIQRNGNQCRTLSYGRTSPMPRNAIQKIPLRTLKPGL